MTSPKKPTTETWGTRIGVILAVAGSAVGLGNFLRFPDLASQYNTGAFMIPYVIALLFLGLPIAWSEWALGRYGGIRGMHSSAGIFRLIWPHPLSPYLGGLGMLVPVVVYMYYVFIESWCLNYAWHYLIGEMHMGNKEAYIDFFATHIGLNENGACLTSPSTMICLGLCMLLNFTLIYRGLNRGIEWFSLRAMPLLVVCALLILVRVLTLGTPHPERPELNVINALGFMWNPTADSFRPGFWESLQNPKMWMQAAGQIFFSLSVGFGVIMTFASYLKKNDDIALSSTTAAAGNEWCEMTLGGLIIIPAAFLFLGPETTKDASGSLFDLGFQTLPMVFQSMPYGQFFGFLFFILLFLAAVTSSISMLQPAIAFFEEGLGLERKGSVIFLGFITSIGTGIVIYFSKNAVALDTMDFWIGTFCIYFLATIQVIFFGWVLGIEKGMKELHRGASIRIPSFVGWILKYISPLYLLTVLAFWLFESDDTGRNKFLNYFLNLQENPAALIPFLFLLAVFVLLMLLISRAKVRWDRTLPLKEERTP